MDVRATRHVDRTDTCLSHLRNRFRTAVEMAQVTPGTHNNRISADTVRNRLREFGLRPCRPYVGIRLTPRRRQVRMAWLTQHRPTLFPLRQWRNVMFSDEPGTCCTELTAVNVCIGVTKSVIGTIAWFNVIGLEVMR